MLPISHYMILFLFKRWVIILKDEVIKKSYKQSIIILKGLSNEKKISYMYHVITISGALYSFV